MLNQYIDHTNLKPYATVLDITKLCQEAIEYDFYGVCVNGAYVNHAREIIDDEAIKIVSVAGFPLGANTLNAKLNEIDLLVAAGVDEIDMVLNIGDLKSGLIGAVEAELRMARVIASDKCLKVILETCYLTDDEIVQVCEIAMAEGIDYVKTSTGFGAAGATLHHVSLMKQVVGDHVKIKASGGIKNREEAQAYIDAGASRIGTSKGIAIVS